MTFRSPGLLDQLSPFLNSRTGRQLMLGGIFGGLFERRATPTVVKDVTPHCFRHTFVCEMPARGTSSLSASWFLTRIQSVRKKYVRRPRLAQPTAISPNNESVSH